ncbi:hypothetical protein FEM08_25260 [Flavobacterium gilvum]|nr:hypothetical protein FEM08_25260 [Flavobacterium gilvum]
MIFLFVKFYFSITILAHNLSFKQLISIMMLLYLLNTFE